MEATNKFRYLISFKGKKEMSSLQQWWQHPVQAGRTRLDGEGNEIVHEIDGEWRDIPREVVEEYL